MPVLEWSRPACYCDMFRQRNCDCCSVNCGTRTVTIDTQMTMYVSPLPSIAHPAAGAAVSTGVVGIRDAKQGSFQLVHD